MEKEVIRRLEGTKSCSISAYLPPDQYDALVSLSEQYCIAISELTRLAIKGMLQGVADGTIGLTDE